MASLVIKQLPDELHAKLKQRAAENHRSMVKEAITLLEAGLNNPSQRIGELPPPYRGKHKLTEKFLNKAKGRSRN